MGQAVFTSLRALAGLVGEIAGVLVTSLLRSLLPCWAASAAAFALVAAWLHLGVLSSPSSPDLLRQIGPGTVYSAYLVAGVLCGTILAAAFAAERAIPQLEVLLNDRVGQLLAAFISNARPAEAALTPDQAARLEAAVEDLRREAAQSTGRLSPRGMVTRFLLGRLASEVHLAAAMEVVTALGAGAQGSSSLAQLQSRVAATVGDDLRRQASRARVLAWGLWILIFAASILPIFLLRWWIPR